MCTFYYFNRRLFMKKKILLCAALVLLVLLCSCGKASTTNAISLNGLEIVLNQSDYQTFISDGWTPKTEDEQIVYEVEIEETIHYEYSISLTKGDLTLAEATFFSEDSQLDLSKWKLVAATINLNGNSDYSKKIVLPIDLLSYETAEEVKAFLQKQFNTSIKRTFQDSTNFEQGIVIDGHYFGILFSESNERLAVSFEVNDIINTSRTKRLYNPPTEVTNQTGTESINQSEKYDFAKIEDRHSFSYNGTLYIVGKHKLSDFLADGWTVVGNYPSDFITNTRSIYEIEYLKRDNVIIGPLCFANGSDTENKQLKDCTLIRCTIPLNCDMKVDYDNTSIGLPYSLLSTMNGQNVSEIFEDIGDYECFSYEQDNGVYFALGIVSPYNAGVLMSADKSSIQYIYMEVNDFYAVEFSK